MNAVTLFASSHPVIAGGLILVGLWTVCCVGIVVCMAVLGVVNEELELRSAQRDVIERLIRSTRERNRYAQLEPRGRG